ncbi:Uncharacterized protein SCF082_LOCUS52433 [Durusdinium trenchii]|uniref:Uncharacterized protein n=1 Tax=Durusdinium trenchii TaxID=1381693 RepID=A0ABP0SL26_9DINO
MVGVAQGSRSFHFWRSLTCCCLGGCVAELVVNIRPPVLVATNMVKDNTSTRMVLRDGDTPESLAAAGCLHLNATGAGCSESDVHAIKDGLEGELMHFKNLSIGGQVMKHISFGWYLLLSHRAIAEARLHFAAAIAKFPESNFLLRELAAAAVLGDALPQPGDDGHTLHRTADGTWAHVTPPEPAFYAITCDVWETYAAIRFQRPKAFLSEIEPELLAAGMSPHAFIPSVQIGSGSAPSGLILEHRLVHDIELLKLLHGMDFLASGVALQAIEACNRTLRSAPRAREGVLQPTVDQWHGLFPFYNRRLHVHPCPRLEQALKPAVEMTMQLLHSPSRRAQTRAGGVLSTGGVLVIDDILTHTALTELRDFAELSTVWYQERDNSLGAALNTGFSTPLLAQIAEGLRELLGDVLCDLPLTDLRAIKFNQELPASIRLQADQAAVTVNLWITPGSADLKDSNGGLTVYDASVEMDNSINDKRMLEDLVQQLDGEHVSVPYRQNRAIVFESSRVYSMQEFTSRESEMRRSRRINVSFLFGLRGLHCAQRRVARIVLEDQSAKQQ